MGNVAMHDRPDVSVVIVSRNTRELLRACLASAMREAGTLATETVVVDNASGDGTPAMVRRDFPAVTVLQPATNDGFAAGNNLGVRRARGRAVLLLNPDTELLPGALPALWEALHAASDVGVVGPRLVYPDGSTQSSRRRFPTLASALVESTLIGETFPRHPAIRRYEMADTPDDAPHDTDWLVEACLLVRREVFDAVGLLDANLFLYGEGPEFCGRVRRAGWRVRYVPAAVVRHHEGTSTGQVVALRQRTFYSSKAYVLGRLHGPLIGGAVRAGLVGDQAARLALEGAKYALGHRRALRAARVAAAAGTLRALLTGARR